MLIFQDLTPDQSKHPETNRTWNQPCCLHRLLISGPKVVPVHYVHFVKYDDAVSFYDAVSDTIRRRGGNRGIFTEEGVDTVAYFGGNHGSRV